MNLAAALRAGAICPQVLSSAPIWGNRNLVCIASFSQHEHQILDSDSLRSYHAIGRNHHRVDFNALIQTNEAVLGGSYGKDYRN
jgi:hypothetical protein